MSNEVGSHFLEDTETPVRNLQRWLRTLFKETGEIPEVFIDGVYDSETRNAVKVFQEKNGIDPTGEADAFTFNAIFEAYRLIMKGAEVLGYAPDFDSFNEGRLAFGDELDDIFVLQALLNTVAIDDARYYVPLSGRFDEKTLGSVNLFRRATGREEGNYVDRALWNDLVRLTRKPQFYT